MNLQTVQHAAYGMQSPGRKNRSLVAQWFAMGLVDEVCRFNAAPSCEQDESTSSSTQDSDDFQWQMDQQESEFAENYVGPEHRECIEDFDITLFGGSND
jgi:hypothetical protein